MIARYPSASVDEEDNTTTITAEWLDRLRDDYRGKFTNYCRIDVEITYENYGDRTISGTVVDLGANYPNFRFEDERHGFLTPASDEDGTAHLLFKYGYTKNVHVPQYKYPIKEIKVNVSDFEHPVCPVCDTEMVYGHADWDVHDPEGYTSEWLCPECFPVRFTEGIE